jgi:hypothetical protein
VSDAQTVREPIRLKVSYKTPEALLGVFTRSVGKGSVALETHRKVAVGTQFLFELHANGVPEPVEVVGEVIQVRPGAKGKFLLGIRYDPGGGRKGIDAVLRRIFDAHKLEKVRRHPRVPIYLRATDESPQSPSYLIRDISRGGVGVEVQTHALPRAVQVGAPVLIEVWLSLGPLSLHGEVVWQFTPPAESGQWINPSFGVNFGKLRQDTVERLERIVTLRGLPPPPWKARISFGKDAVARMPSSQNGG